MFGVVGLIDVVVCSFGWCLVWFVFDFWVVLLRVDWCCLVFAGCICFSVIFWLVLLFALIVWVLACVYTGRLVDWFSGLCVLVVWLLYAVLYIVHSIVTLIWWGVCFAVNMLWWVGYMMVIWWLLYWLVACVLCWVLFDRCGLVVFGLVGCVAVVCICSVLVCVL